MQRFISLEIIDKIFTEHALFKVPPMAQIIYIRALMDYFKKAEKSSVSFRPFAKLKKDIPNYEKFEIHFKTLQVCGLVKIDYKQVVFLDFWSDKIDLHLVGEILIFGDAKTYFDELRHDERIKKHCMDRYSLDEKTYFSYFEKFLEAQDLVKRQYNNKGDCFSHWTNWLRLQIGTLAPDRVVSTGKKLG